MPFKIPLGIFFPGILAPSIQTNPNCLSPHARPTLKAHFRRLRPPHPAADVVAGPHTDLAASPSPRSDLATATSSLPASRCSQKPAPPQMYLSTSSSPSPAVAGGPSDPTIATFSSPTLTAALPASPLPPSRPNLQCLDFSGASMVV